MFTESVLSYIAFWRDFSSSFLSIFYVFCNFLVLNDHLFNLYDIYIPYIDFALSFPYILSLLTSTANSKLYDFYIPRFLLSLCACFLWLFYCCSNIVRFQYSSYLYAKSISIWKAILLSISSSPNYQSLLKENHIPVFLLHQISVFYIPSYPFSIAISFEPYMVTVSQFPIYLQPVFYICIIRLL